MKLFVYDENIVKHGHIGKHVNKFTGVQYIDRKDLNVLGDDYRYFIGSYDELKCVHPSSYILLSDESHVSNYNTGYVIGSDCFTVSSTDSGVDVLFDSDSYSILEYVDDFARQDNYKMIDCPTNRILAKYLELSNIDIVRYDYSNFDTRLINRQNVIDAINGDRIDIKFLLCPVSSVVEKGDIKIFRFDTYNPNFGARDVLSGNNSSCPVYISISNDNRYCFRISVNELKNSDKIMTMDDFYALALPFDKSVMDRRQHLSDHKQLEDESCFNIDTFIYDNGVDVDNGKCCSSDYSFAELVNTIDAGLIYERYYATDPLAFEKNIELLYDRKNGPDKRLLQQQIIRMQLDDLSRSYTDISVRSEFVKTFDIIGGRDGIKSLGTMMLLPNQSGQYQVSDVFGMGDHTLWSGRADAFCFNNDQVPDTIRSFHFGDGNTLHFPNNYEFVGFDPSTSAHISDVQRSMEIIDTMDADRRQILLTNVGSIKEPVELTPYVPAPAQLAFDPEHDIELTPDYDRSL